MRRQSSRKTGRNDHSGRVKLIEAVASVVSLNKVLGLDDEGLDGLKLCEGSVDAKVEENMVEAFLRDTSVFEAALVVSSANTALINGGRAWVEAAGSVSSAHSASIESLWGERSVVTSSAAKSVSVAHTAFISDPSVSVTREFAVSSVSVAYTACISLFVSAAHSLEDDGGRTSRLREGSIVTCFVVDDVCSDNISWEVLKKVGSSNIKWKVELGDLSAYISVIGVSLVGEENLGIGVTDDVNDVKVKVELCCVSSKESSANSVSLACSEWSRGELELAWLEEDPVVRERLVKDNLWDSVGGCQVVGHWASSSLREGVVRDKSLCVARNSSLIELSDLLRGTSDIPESELIDVSAPGLESRVLVIIETNTHWLSNSSKSLLSVARRCISSPHGAVYEDSIDVERSNSKREVGLVFLPVDGNSNVCPSLFDDGVCLTVRVEHLLV